MNLGLLMSIGSPSMPMTSSGSPSIQTESSGFGNVFQNMMAASDMSTKVQSLGASLELSQVMNDIVNAETLEDLANLLEQLKQIGEKSSVTNHMFKDVTYRPSKPVVTEEEQLLQKVIPIDSKGNQVIMSLEEGVVPSESSTHDQLIESLLFSNSNVQTDTTKDDTLINKEQIMADPERVVPSSQPAEDVKSENIQLVDLAILQKFPSLQQLTSLITENPDKLVEAITNVLEFAGVTKEQLEEIQSVGDIWFTLDVIQTISPEKIQLAVQQLPEKVRVELTALFKSIELAGPKMDLYEKQVELVKTIQPLVAQFVSKFEEKTSQSEIKQTIPLPVAVQHMIRFTTNQQSTDTKQQEGQSKSNETSSIQSILPQTESKPVFQMTQAEKVSESRSEALMREFQAVLNRANFGQTNGMNRLSIKLYPEHLGQVRIELLEVNGVMTARILASTAMAREMLDSQMHQLRHAFNQQNLQVDRIDLSQTIQDLSKNDREQAFNKQNEQQKEQSSEQNQTQDESEMTFEEFMIELEV
ncbi:hypothetical protein DV702_02600 [Sporosarcina sp. PTS2304]|uniref:flagellar hook-length control protein FliK n=1 Tax=Sporosarcina sp. PTS2304 TaxID=2283194 RepID=UPI000E0DBBB9|nr:flagellar hook-length control protein FliK [Sporosarcina sp. PTS2304]AXH98703.1 hypothetical protein DV702_02600 [Sporosarcina sp. PTS2304]